MKQAIVHALTALVGAFLCSHLIIGAFIYNSGDAIAFGIPFALFATFIFYGVLRFIAKLFPDTSVSNKTASVMLVAALVVGLALEAALQYVNP